MLITVSNTTKYALLAHSEKTGLSIGEIIDHMAMNCTYNDPKSAATVVFGDFSLVVAGQTEKQLCETIYILIDLYIKALLIGGLDRDDVFEEISRRLQEDI